MRKLFLATLACLFFGSAHGAYAQTPTAQFTQPIQQNWKVDESVVRISDYTDPLGSLRLTQPLGKNSDEYRTSSWNTFKASSGLTLGRLSIAAAASTDELDERGRPILPDTPTGDASYALAENIFIRERKEHRTFTFGLDFKYCHLAQMFSSC
jgi:hypothetical protein